MTTVALTSGAPLAFLILAALVALVSHGALVGFVLSRTWRLGLTGAISDAVLRRAVLVAAILLAVYWLVAQDFARNPP